jgi:hypothetical protein
MTIAEPRAGCKSLVEATKQKCTTEVQLERLREQRQQLRRYHDGHQESVLRAVGPTSYAFRCSKSSQHSHINVHGPVFSTVAEVSLTSDEDAEDLYYDEACKILA